MTVHFVRNAHRSLLEEPGATRAHPTVRPSSCQTARNAQSLSESPRLSDRSAIDIAISGRQDLNLRPLPPQGSALPGCATSRHSRQSPASGQNGEHKHHPATRPPPSTSQVAPTADRYANPCAASRTAGSISGYRGSSASSVSTSRRAIKKLRTNLSSDGTTYHGALRVLHSFSASR